jgi:predicted kinase
MHPSPPSPSEARRLAIPSNGLVLLVGVSGSGKSTFAARHFAPTQVLSSDAMRAMVADDPNDQGATDAAFELLHTALGLRLAAGRLSVVDATNVERWARGRILAVARRLGRPASALVLAVPFDVCMTRNATRTDRRLPEAVLRRQQSWLHDSIPSLPGEGFAPVWVLSSVAEVDAIEIEVVGA